MKKETPKRIAIIGLPGSGKSTFATKLGEYLNIPVHHLDKQGVWTSAKRICFGAYMMNVARKKILLYLKSIIIILVTLFCISIIIICYPQLYYFNDKIEYKNFQVYYDKKIPDQKGFPDGKVYFSFDEEGNVSKVQALLSDGTILWEAVPEIKKENREAITAECYLFAQSRTISLKTKRPRLIFTKV